MKPKPLSDASSPTLKLLPRKKTKVCLIAWFLNDERKWIADSINSDDFEVHYVGSPWLVDIRQKRTPFLGWLSFLLLAVKARIACYKNRPDVVVTAFPQVAIMVAVVNALTMYRPNHIAWYFNCGHAYTGLRRLVSQIFFKRIDRFIVYTQKERENYAQIFNLPEERFFFTYLTGEGLGQEQFDSMEISTPKDRFIISGGSSSRDFKTLINATEGLGLHVLLVTHAHAIADMEIPDYVTVIESVPQDMYLALLAQAYISVIPVDNPVTASGQMTLIQSYQLETPTIATRCIGTEDYIADRQTGIFVEPHDVKGMRNAIQELVYNEALYNSIRTTAKAFGDTHFTDASLGSVFVDVWSDMKRNRSKRAEWKPKN